MYETLWRYHVTHAHVYLPHPEGFKDFGSEERNQGPNHELILKYQVLPLGHVGTTTTI